MLVKPTIKCEGTSNLLLASLKLVAEFLWREMGATTKARSLSKSTAAAVVLLLEHAGTFFTT